MLKERREVRPDRDSTSPGAVTARRCAASEVINVSEEC